MSAAPVARLDAAAARRLTRDLQRALDVAVELLGQAFRGRAWEPLGYDSWNAYCAAELPQLAIIGKGLPADERGGLLVELRRETGGSLRAVAAPFGISASQARRDLIAAGEQRDADVIGLDGRRRPATSAAAPTEARKARPLVDRLVELVAAHPGGLSVLDVVKLARVRQSQASPALCRLAAAGRLDYLPGARRGQLGRYVIGSDR